MCHCACHCGLVPGVLIPGVLMPGGCCDHTSPIPYLLWFTRAHSRGCIHAVVFTRLTCADARNAPTHGDLTSLARHTPQKCLLSSVLHEMRLRMVIILLSHAILHKNVSCPLASTPHMTSKITKPPQNVSAHVSSTAARSSSTAPLWQPRAISAPWQSSASIGEGARKKATGMRAPPFSSSSSSSSSSA